MLTENVGSARSLDPAAAGMRMRVASLAIDTIEAKEMSLAQVEECTSLLAPQPFPRRSALRSYFPH